MANRPVSVLFLGTKEGELFLCIGGGDEEARSFFKKAFYFLLVKFCVIPKSISFTSFFQNYTNVKYKLFLDTTDCKN